MLGSLICPIVWTLAIRQVARQPLPRVTPEKEYSEVPHRYGWSYYPTPVDWQCCFLWIPEPADPSIYTSSAPSPVFLFVELLFWPQQQGQESETYIAVNIGNFKLWIKLWIFKSGKDPYKKQWKGGEVQKIKKGGSVVSWKKAMLQIVQVRILNFL